MVGFDLCNIYRGSKSFCYPCGVLESKRQRKTPLRLTHRCSHQRYQRDRFSLLLILFDRWRCVLQQSV
ncbi:hypothetical protein V6Z11_D10G104300 [Gossypium hirsutum]